jgi:transcriptional regulator with XRE-family HTH domain
MSSAGDRILTESDIDRVASAVTDVAGVALTEIEESLPRALAGDRGQVRLYVDAYRRLVERILDAVVEARSDLVAVDRRTGGLAVAELRASGSRMVTTSWLRAALEQSAMSAPFTDWLVSLGVGKGTAVAFVARMRETLPGVEPLRVPIERRLPEWDLDANDAPRFCRSVADELERAEAPLARIRTVLGLSRTELAALFGVRRQALDHWDANGVPAERREKLATIEEVADLLAAKLKRDRIPGVVRRPSPAYGNSSALDAIAADDQDLVLAELRDAFDWAAAA